jgi:hypothetical protein
MNRSPILRSALVFAFLWIFSVPAWAANSASNVDRADEAHVLVLTPGLEGKELADFLDRLEAKGLEIPVAVAGTGCIVIDSPEARIALAGETAISSLHRSAVPADSQTRSVAGRGLLTYWNRKLEARSDAGPFPKDHSSSSTESPAVEICSGAVTLEEAIRRRGVSSRCSAPSGSGRIHFASGKTIVNLILPESEGPASIQDWTPAQIEDIEAELVRALAWWNLKTGREVSFVLVSHGAVGTSYEAGLLNAGDEELYLADCMQSLGYDGECGYAELDQFNEAVREEYRGQWSFTQVVLHANEFVGGGMLAYAYLGGPHTVALSGNGYLGTRRLDRVIAHEIGHIFQALDEYQQACDCTQRSGYLNERNGNCVACPVQIGKCVMRAGNEYSEAEMEQMETHVHPCLFTLGQMGVRDGNEDGILDVRETVPETALHTDLPDTVFGTRNVPVKGKAWDLPYAFAPPSYANPVTLNTIATVIFSIDGRGWLNAHPEDGFWSEKEEDFEIRLPEVGGGSHRLWVRAVNSIQKQDSTPVKMDFFVYDVILYEEMSVFQEGSNLIVRWRINGEDFGSTYTLLRREEGGAEEPIAEIPSRGSLSAKYTFVDEHIVPAREYVYSLEVDIPGKGRKALGSARGKTYLAEPPPGHIVSLSPNPTSGSTLITVSVPRGARNGGVGPPPDDDDGDHIPLSPWLRDDDDPPPGGGDGALLWRLVRMELFDVAGRRVRDLGTTRQLELSRFNVWWDGNSDEGAPAPAGVYFLRTVIGETLETSRIILVR